MLNEKMLFTYVNNCCRNKNDAFVSTWIILTNGFHLAKADTIKLIRVGVRVFFIAN